MIGITANAVDDERNVVPNSTEFGAPIPVAILHFRDSPLSRKLGSFSFRQADRSRTITDFAPCSSPASSRSFERRILPPTSGWRENLINQLIVFRFEWIDEHNALQRETILQVFSK